MAKTRCSNCEKSVDSRDKTGKTYSSRRCQATGEKITGGNFYSIRKCEEFLPRVEYVDQFYNPIDRAVELIEKGKRIRDIIDPL
jgi:hypothetical protein